MRYVIGFGLLVVLPFALGLALLTEGYDRMFRWIDRGLERAGL